MKYYIEQLKTFLDNVYNSRERKRVVVDCDDLFMINVYGHNDSHCFSVKLSKCPQETISFYGYNLEKTLDLTEANFKQVTQWIVKSIHYGSVLSVYTEDRKISSYEFIADKKLTKEDIKNIFRELQRNDGKTTFPCTLVYYDFLGENSLSFEV